MIESVEDGAGNQLAFIVRAGQERRPGVNFVTNVTTGLQVAFSSYGAGHVIRPHRHNQLRPVAQPPVEVIEVHRGSMRVDFYSGVDVIDQGGGFCQSRVLCVGDVVVLIAGGHGMVMSGHGCDFLEVRQGPYYGRQNDKVDLDVV